MRHGPHHSAQKSTSTGPSAPSTSTAKLWSVTVLVAMTSESPFEGFTAIWALGHGLSRHEFDELRSGGVEQGCANVPPWKDLAQRLGIGPHLRAMRCGNVDFGFRHPSGFVVDDRHAILFDEQTIDRPGDDPSIRQGCGKGRLAERACTEQG